jgi:hypothetical protein
LHHAGFRQRLGFWVSPGGERVMNMDDALAGLDSGEIQPGGVTHSFAVSEGVLSHARITEEGIRSADEARDRRPEPPQWLLAQADVIASATVAKLKPLIRAEVRAALRAEAGKREPSK